MKRSFLLLLGASFLAISAKSQNVGIGTSTPTIAKLEIKGVAEGGATVAAFGTESSGISFQRNWPTIGFNQYRDNTAGNGKYMSTGFAAIQFLDPGSGAMLIDMLGQGSTGALTTSGTRAITILNNGNVGIRNNAGNASLWVSRGSNFEGTAVFSGTLHNSHFNYGTNEDTYIRPGTNNGKVIINDIPNAKIQLGNGNANVGINISPSTYYNLDINQNTTEGGIRLKSPDWYDTYWELRNEIYSNDGQTSCLMLKNNGTIKGWFRPDNGQWSAQSDSRLKKNIVSIGTVLKKVLSLNVMSYEMIYNNPTHNQSFGLIAQEVKEIFPEIVDQTPSVADQSIPGTLNNQMGISYAQIGVIAIKAIQEQQQIIEQQQKQIDMLINKLNALEKRNN